MSRKPPNPAEGPPNHQTLLLKEMIRLSERVVDNQIQESEEQVRRSTTAIRFSTTTLVVALFVVSLILSMGWELPVGSLVATFCLFTTFFSMNLVSILGLYRFGISASGQRMLGVGPKPGHLRNLEDDDTLDTAPFLRSVLRLIADQYYWNMRRVQSDARKLERWSRWSLGSLAPLALGLITYIVGGLIS